MTSELFALPRPRVAWVWPGKSVVARNSGVHPGCAGVPLGRDTAHLCAAQLAAARRAFTVAAAWPAAHDACSSPWAARWVPWQLHSAHGLASAPAAAEAPVDPAAESDAAQEPVRLTDNAVQVRARAARWPSSAVRHSARSPASSRPWVAGRLCVAESSTAAARALSRSHSSRAWDTPLNAVLGAQRLRELLADVAKPEEKVLRLTVEAAAAQASPTGPRHCGRLGRLVSAAGSLPVEGS